MARTDDLVPSLQQRLNTDIGYHQGVVVNWDPQTGDNVIDMAGTILNDLPMLNISEALTMKPGYVVALLRFKSTYFILGRVVIPNTPDFFSGGMPNLAQAFYQQNSDAAIQTNSLGAYNSKLVSAMIINHPRVSLGGKIITSGITTTGQFRVQWYTSYPSGGASPPGGTLMFESIVYGTPTGTAAAVVGPIEYIWPAGMLGMLVYVSYEVIMSTGTAGVDWVSVVPTAFYGHGV